MNVQPIPTTVTRPTHAAAAKPVDDGPVELFERRKFYLPALMSPYREVEQSQASRELADHHTLYTRVGAKFAPVATPGDLAALLAFHGLATTDPPASAKPLLKLAEHGVKLSQPAYQAYLTKEHRWSGDAAALEYRLDGLVMRPDELSKLEDLKSHAKQKPYAVMLDVCRHLKAHQQPLESVKSLAWPFPENSRSLFTRCLAANDDLDVLGRLVEHDFDKTGPLMLSFGLVPGVEPTDPLAKEARRLSELHSPQTLVALRDALNASRLSQEERLGRFQMLGELARDASTAGLLTRMVETGFDRAHTESLLSRLAEPIGSTSLQERVATFERLIKMDKLEEPLNRYDVMESLYEAYATNGSEKDVTRLRDTLLAKDPKRIKLGLDTYRADPDHLDDEIKLLSTGWATNWVARTLEQAPDAIDLVDQMLQPAVKFNWQDSGAWIHRAGQTKDPAARKLLLAMAERGYSLEATDRHLDKIDQPQGSTSLGQRIEAYRRLVDFDKLAVPLSTYSVMESIYDAYTAEIQAGRPAEKALHDALELRQALQDRKASAEEFEACFNGTSGRLAATVPLLKPLLAKGWGVDLALKAAPLLEGHPEREEGLEQLRQDLLAARLDAARRSGYLKLLPEDRDRCRLLGTMAKTGFSPEQAEKFQDLVAPPVKGTSCRQRVYDFEAMIGMDNLTTPFNLYAVMEAAYGAYRSRIEAGDSRASVMKGLDALRDALNGAKPDHADFPAAYGHWADHPELDPARVARVARGVAQSRRSDTTTTDFLKVLDNCHGDARAELTATMAEKGFSHQAAGEIVELLGRPLADSSPEQKVAVFKKLVEFDTLPEPLNQFSVMESLYRTYDSIIHSGTEPERAARLVLAARDRIRQQQPADFDTALKPFEATSAWSEKQTAWFESLVQAGNSVEGSAKLASTVADSRRPVAEELLSTAGDADLAATLYQSLQTLVRSGKSETEARDFVQAVVEHERQRSGTTEGIRAALDQAVEMFGSLQKQGPGSIEQAPDEVVIGDFNLPIGPD